MHPHSLSDSKWAWGCVYIWHYNLGRPLGRDVFFSFGSYGYHLCCTIAAVSAQWLVEHVKKNLQNITTERTPHSVQYTVEEMRRSVENGCESEYDCSNGNQPSMTEKNFGISHNHFKTSFQSSSSLLKGGTDIFDMHIYDRIALLFLFIQIVQWWKEDMH